MDTVTVHLTVFVDEVDDGVFMARLPDQFQAHPGYGATPERAIYELLNPQNPVSLRTQADALARWIQATYATLPDLNNLPGNISVFRRKIRNSNPDEGA